MDSAEEPAADPTVRIALAGDTMLGRGVARQILEHPGSPLVSADVASLIAEADVFVLNLECCISDRGSAWPDPSKAFFFRAPPEAAELLGSLGVSCVTLANNHALDFGEEGLLDTFRHLKAAGIRWVGAGADQQSARAPVVLEVGTMRLGIVAMTDHPAEFAAGPDRPGTAYADLHGGVADWVISSIEVVESDAVLVTPHWGPNMVSEPLGYVRTAARALVDAGATLVAGHSAHVFHGIEGRVLYDLGDFLDDYAVDPVLRNDLGLLFLITLGRRGPILLEAVPLKLDFCFTSRAGGDDATWISKRFRDSCERLGTSVSEEGGRLVVSRPPDPD